MGTVLEDCEVLGEGDWWVVRDVVLMGMGLGGEGEVRNNTDIAV